MIRDKIRHYRQIDLLHVHREVFPLTNELPEESNQFRVLHSICLAILKGSVGLILAKTSVMRISILLDLSSRDVIPLYRFIRSRRPIVSIGFSTHHSFIMTCFDLVSHHFYSDVYKQVLTTQTCLFFPLLSSFYPVIKSCLSPFFCLQIKEPRE